MRREASRQAAPPREEAGGDEERGTRAASERAAGSHVHVLRQALAKGAGLAVSPAPARQAPQGGLFREGGRHSLGEPARRAPSTRMEPTSMEMSSSAKMS